MIDSVSSQTLDLIYSAAIEPHLWSEVVDRLLEMADAQSAWISKLVPPTGAGAGYVFNIDEAFQKSYFEYFNKLDPISNVQAQDLEALGVITDEHRIAKPDLLKGEFYNDFMRPQDAHSIAILHFGTVGAEVCSINLNRGRSARGFDPQCLDRLRAIQPHLARAFRTSRQLGDLGLDRRSSSSILLDVDQPLIVINSSRRVRSMNAAADQTIAALSGLIVKDARLSASDPTSQNRLERSVLIASSTDPAIRQSSSLTISIAGKSAPIELTISPLQSSGLETIFKERLVGVFIHPTPTRDIPPKAPLETLALSASERRLVLALYSGCTLKQASVQFGVSYNTVRTQLARVFSKTGVRRQADLIRLLSSPVT